LKLDRYHTTVLTLDAPQPGKREEDDRVKNELDPARYFDDDYEKNEQEEDSKSHEPSLGLGRSLFVGSAADLTWDNDTLTRLRNQIPAGMPVILKGVHTYEDAILASKVTLKIYGIYLWWD
jgi:hypothetical protein